MGVPYKVSACRMPWSTVLSIFFILLVTPIFSWVAFANALCQTALEQLAFELHQKLPGSTRITTEGTPPSSWEIKRVVGEKEIASLEAHRAEDGSVRVHITVKDESKDKGENYQGKGLSKVLFAELLKQLPTDVRIATTLSGTNGDVFRDTLKALSDPKSSNYRSDLDLQQRQLLAVKATPAWKLREAAGLTKILKMDVWGNAQYPRVDLMVTRENTASENRPSISPLISPFRP